MEKVVEDFIKTWEMELSHKMNFSQWTTVNADKFEIVPNENSPVPLEKVQETGNYNALLQGCPAHKWSRLIIAIKNNNIDS